jgi:lysophospholipase L1-like esterase
MNPARPLLIAALLSSPALAADPVLIEQHGDSTTYGTTGTDKSGYRVSELNESYDLGVWIAGVTVANRGAPGTTCNDRLNGGLYYTKNIWQEMSASKAAIVTFSYGLNDAWHRQGVDFYRYCLDTLIRVAKGYGKIVAIETPLGDSARDYAAAAVSAAADGGAYLIDHEALMDSRYPDWRNHLPDGVHPDDELYIQKASIAFSVLNPIVSTMTRN